jgi:hypothetical protein
VILLAPAADRGLRVLRHEPAWREACSAITPAPLTWRGLCAGRESRWRSLDATAAIRCSRPWVPWPLPLTMTWSCGVPSVASVYSTALLCSTKTTRCMTRSRRSWDGSPRAQPHRPGRPVKRCWLAWTRRFGRDLDGPSLARRCSRTAPPTRSRSRRPARPSRAIRYLPAGGRGRMTAREAGHEPSGGPMCSTLKRAISASSPPGGVPSPSGSWAASVGTPDSVNICSTPPGVKIASILAGFSP